MRILFLSPSFPAEMPLFVRALAQVGVEVVGAGDLAAAMPPSEVREARSGYVQVGLGREHEPLEGGRRHPSAPFDRVGCLWGPGVMLAAKLRHALGVPGLDEAR